MVLTFFGTPDLENEGNPISAIFNMGWLGLWLANIFAVLAFCLFSYIAFEKYVPKDISAESFFEYYLMLFYNRREMIVKPMMKFPKNWMPFFAMICYSACISLIAGRAVDVLEWIAVLLGYENSMYFVIRYFVPLGRFDIWVFIIAFLVSVLHWMQKGYRRAHKRFQDENAGGAL